MGFGRYGEPFVRRRASSEIGLCNDRWRFLGFGKMPEETCTFGDLAEFTFLCKLLNQLFWVLLLLDMVGVTFSCKSLNHLFSTLAVRCRRDFACSNEFCIICLSAFLCKLLNQLFWVLLLLDMVGFTFSCM